MNILLHCFQIQRPYMNVLAIVGLTIICLAIQVFIWLIYKYITYIFYSEFISEVHSAYVYYSL